MELWDRYFDGTNFLKSLVKHHESASGMDERRFRSVLFRVYDVFAATVGKTTLNVDKQFLATRETRHRIVWYNRGGMDLICPHGRVIESEVQPERAVLVLTGALTPECPCPSYTPLAHWGPCQVFVGERCADDD